MAKRPMGYFHSEDCTIEYLQAKAEKAQARSILLANRERAKKVKVLATQDKADRARLKNRTGKNGYYDNLKVALHFYVKHVLRKGEPCYTCDRPQKFSDSPQAFHVGHFMPAKMVDPRRFMLENLRMQCLKCNSYHSGRHGVYKEVMIKEMGADHVEWLECEANHKELKEQYPTTKDIQAEAARYRKLSK